MHHNKQISTIVSNQTGTTGGKKWIVNGSTDTFTGTSASNSGLPYKGAKEVIPQVICIMSKARVALQ